MISLILGAWLLNYAKEVETIALKPNQILNVKLSLGKTTLLRFEEKPLKVIIGNKNYFNLEASENDIAIQPLGKATTNLFVYLKDQTYSFILAACDGCLYDDFIIVRSQKEDAKEIVLSHPTRDKSKALAKKITLGKLIIELKSIKKVKDRYLLDFELNNPTSKTFKATDFSINMKTKDRRISNQEFAFEFFEIDPGKTKGLISFQLKEKTNLVLEVKNGKIVNKLILEKGVL